MNSLRATGPKGLLVFPPTGKSATAFIAIYQKTN